MYSRITATQNGRDAIAYAEGNPHNNAAQRNLKVTPINMITNGRYANQMQRYWNKATSKHKVQVRRLIVSFSQRELNPDNPEDLEKANQIMKQFIKEEYPDRQAVLYFQADGKGHNLHCHAIINDVSMTDHKACDDNHKHYSYIASKVDNVAKRYIDIDNGIQQTQEKKTQYERQAEDSEAYSYKQDMKQRILEAAKSAKDKEDFMKQLEERGITAQEKDSKKYGKYYTFDFVQCPIKVKNTKARSYKLGDMFSPESLSSMYNTHTTEKKRDERVSQGYEIKSMQEIVEEATRSAMDRLQKSERQSSEQNKQNK